MKTIKGLAILTIAIVLLSGCGGGNSGTCFFSGRSYEIDRAYYKLYEVDGCEYFVSSSSTIIAHKGDCKNPLHQMVIHDTVWMERK